MNLIPYAIWLFIILGCVMRDVLLMKVSEGKKYWDMRARCQLDEQSDKFVWRRLFGGIATVKNSPFFCFFVFILNNQQKKQLQKMEGEGCELSKFFIFRNFFITYEKKKMECGLEFFNFILIDLEQSTQLLGTSLQQLKLAGYWDIMWAFSICFQKGI